MEQQGISSSTRSGQMESIVTEHKTALLRYAARILGDPTAAQDVVQNAFIKLFKSWQDGTRPTRALRGWLFRVTHNEAIDYIRRESRLRNLHEQHAEQKGKNCPDGRNCPTGSDERKEMVLNVMKKLHPREQQVVLLRLEEGLSYKQIAEVTGRSEGNVGNILCHAVRKLSVRVKAATGPKD